MSEIWKDVLGYEGYYQVSNRGGVRSLDRIITDKNGRSMKYSGGDLSVQSNENGYCTVVLMKNRKGKNFKVHKLVAETFIPNTRSKAYVNHKDGNKANNTVSNLEWCTASENNKHAYELGLKRPYNRKGVRVGGSKFNLTEVAEIQRQHRDCGGSHGTVYLARKYQVHKDTITNLIKGKTYVKSGVVHG